MFVYTIKTHPDEEFKVYINDQNDTEIIYRSWEGGEAGEFRAATTEEFLKSILLGQINLPQELENTLIGQYLNGDIEFPSCIKALLYKEQIRKLNLSLIRSIVSEQKDRIPTNRNKRRGK